jgi:hypothetical protein
LTRNPRDLQGGTRAAVSAEFHAWRAAYAAWPIPPYPELPDRIALGLVARRAKHFRVRD